VPVVSNCLPLTKIHQAAFDANLIGIDLQFESGPLQERVSSELDSAFSIAAL
jgi:predicted restriction endonuclease